MEFSEIIKQRREQLGLSQEDLAFKMGYKSRSSINKIETGRPVSHKLMLKFAQVLGLDPAEIILNTLEEQQKEISKVEDAVHTELEPLLYMGLTPDEAKLVTDYAKFLVSQRKKNNE